MASNHKLTALLKGRTLVKTSREGDLLLLSFDDGSTMRVETGTTNADAPTVAGRVLAVRQQGTQFHLDFEGGASLPIQIAEATSSVLLRDRNNVLEYAD